MTRSPRASARGFLLWGFRPGLLLDVAERVVEIKAPGGSWGTPGTTTTQRAMPIRGRPPTRCPCLAVRRSGCLR